MFNKILVAIDRSTANRKVFEEALFLAKAMGGNLILLHVLSGEEEDSPIMSVYPTFYPTIGDHYMHLDPQISHLANETYHKQWKAFEEEGLKILRSFAKDARAAGVETEFSQISGHPSSTICDFAKSCNADVIFIGRRGYSGLKEVFLGSVSNYVVHHAPCSVLLVQTPIQSKKRQSSSQSLELTPNS
ncbi:MAG: universal stress protein [Xenococcaceae cyanobacterium MO_167.B27]|nr:universal stress protein [Xenococcaceae cyanobacterium MO_167.B27]